MKKNIALHMISDSSGETVLGVAKASCAQFEQLQVTERVWPLTRSKKQIGDVINEIMNSEDQCVIIYTILDHELRLYLKEQASKYNILCISAIGHIVKKISNFTDIQAIKTGIPGKQRMVPHYYDKIESVDFCIQHDDGKLTQDYNQADILLLGVSRTSKSPTAFYLGQRGYKTANFPILQHSKFLDLEKIQKPFIVGLTIASDILLKVRMNRMLTYNTFHTHIVKQNYTNFLKITEEINYAKRLFARYKIPMVDVSSKAIEEIAAEIITLYLKK